MIGWGRKIPGVRPPKASGREWSGMQAEQHQGAGLKYLTITPDGYDPELPYPLMIMLHGFGANMQDLAGLAPAISATGYVYACPNAPIHFDLGGGHIGYGWTSPPGHGQRGGG